jgi:hypothetical protein
LAICSRSRTMVVDTSVPGHLDTLEPPCVRGNRIWNALPFH